MKLNVKQLTEFLLILGVLIQAVYGIEVSISGGDGGESGSVSTKIEVEDEAALSYEASINGATIMPETRIMGPTSLFEETHGVKDSTGKSASVYVKVVNAPNGLSYNSAVLPQEGAVGAQSWISAEQWLTVPKADSIKVTASSSYKSLSADVGLEETKGSLSGDYVALNGYYGKAYASATQVDARQVATDGTGKSIRIYGHAKDSSGSFSVDTPINSISGLGPVFNGLDALSSAGTTTQVSQKEHIKGGFTSTAAAGTQIKTRTSNYGNEYDLNMLAKKVGVSYMATGVVGYYVDINNPSANKIQGAVTAANSGDIISIASGKYYENVQIDKSLLVKGAGKNKTTVDGNKVNRVFFTGKTNPNIDVTLSSMTIQNGATSGYGGGINNRGTLTVDNCKISGNTASFGGGIYNQGKLTVRGASLISGNTATHGGGIYNYASGTATVIGSTISGNTANSGGGGVNNEGTASIKDSIISGNVAKYSGSAILNKGTGISTVTNSTISGNTAKYGSIYNAPTAKLTVTSSTISGNKADYGGGIDNDGTLEVKDSRIINNVAIDGGGIYNLGTATLTGSTISGNDVNTNISQGGGIYNEGKATVNRCIISGNKAKFTGGGIWNSHVGNVAITDSIISGNIAGYGGVRGVGGGIENDGIMSLTNTTVSWNTASYGGGGINNLGGTLNLYSGSIDHNQAGHKGGGIRNYNGGTVNLIGSYPVLSIDHNTAPKNGGMSSDLSTVNGLPYPWSPIVHDNTPNP